jgi:hypothetical protein
MRDTASAAGRPNPPQVVQYMPCAVRRDRDDARRAAKFAIAEMLPNYWTLGQKLPAAKAALTQGTGISDAEFDRAATLLRAGEPADGVLDDRYVDAFSIAGDSGDCRKQAAAYAAAGVTELALTFSGMSAADDMAYAARALAGA